MARQAVPPKPKTNWADLGAQFMAARNYRSALQAFANAAQADKGVAIHRFHQAQAHLALGEFGPAAEQLTEALRLRPDMIDAARQLGVLIANVYLPASVQLNRIGLRAALEFDRFNRDEIAEAAVYYLSLSDSLRSALDLGRREGFLTAARQLCLKETSELLKDELLNKALGDNIIRIPDLELLLTSLRRVFLLELPTERFHDRALTSFILTLMRQCWINEYVWSTSGEEDASLETWSIDTNRLFAGDAEEGVRFLLAGLYQPVASIIDPGVSLEQLKRLRPNAVRDAVVKQVGEHTDLRARARQLARLATIADSTSLKVAAQYEGSPYPRWTSLGLLADEIGWKEMLSRAFGQHRLAFTSSPFEVLIAGCGTGRQAVAAASVYGPNARITAVDLSASSLAYAQRMAEKFSVNNINFIHGDILDLQNNPEFASRFKIIESVGVLHHMADPLQGWRCLKGCLADDGFMLIALYSEIARRKWTALKKDPEFPGENCDDKALRRFRKSLLARPEEEVGAEFKYLRDLYMTSGFRDLILHVSERRFTLPEIAKFLSEEGLAFRGFFNAQAFEKLRRQFPEETWPGSLEHWAEFETANPTHFTGMYYFWCGPV